ncbi:MAG: TRAP transporter small permease [Burkholderiaceae bacterium]|nr:TRAP transporter small permease [Burkholderiaceae bacterium]
MRAEEPPVGASGGSTRIARLRRLEQVLTLTAAAPLLCLVGVTVVDVFGRYLLDKPLAGGFEITEMLLAIVVFASLPLVELHDEHITIDLLDGLYARRGRFWRQLGVYSLSGVAMAVISWRLFAKARLSAADHVTSAVLSVPVAPIAYFIASMCALAAFVLFIKIFDQLARAKGPREVD